jgi:hypothetical protein
LGNKPPDSNANGQWVLLVPNTTHSHHQPRTTTNLLHECVLKDPIPEQLVLPVERGNDFLFGAGGSPVPAQQHASHTPRSLMPVLPHDVTLAFYKLVFILGEAGRELNKVIGKGYSESMIK